MNRSSGITVSTTRPALTKSDEANPVMGTVLTPLVQLGYDLDTNYDTNGVSDDIDLSACRLQGSTVDDGLVGDTGMDVVSEEHWGKLCST